MSSSPMRSRSPRTVRHERQTNFKVVVRVRPPLPRELAGDVPFQNIVAIDEREQEITVSENIDAVIDENGNAVANPGPYTTHRYMFDHVYDQNASQKRVYETTARTVVDSALQGYNATIFAYGQTGTGKTFTMEGFNREGSIEARGIIPRAIEQIFGHIQRFASPRMRFLVRASYLQIYNEAISDLLKPERSNLNIREDKKRGVYVDGLSEWVVRSPAEIYGLMERGGAVRATGETKMNEVSSRSHAVFIVIAEQSETVYIDENGVEMGPEELQMFMHRRGVHREQEMSRLEDQVKQSFKVGKLNLVDLAGSERVRLSGATGQRLEESKQINRSLSALGNVISALTDAKARQHIPYRDSKLTRMLEDSLGGNCKTTMMAMISPALEAILETISTLKFANRAKNIRNEARVNEDLDQKSLLRKYERELRRLRAELEERSKNVVDKRRLLELDEQRRRAEADKMAAIRALEARSLEFMHEKEEKKRLEQRIAMLMGQMIRGERNPADGTNGALSLGEESGPESQVLMKQQQEQLRQEYEGKLADLERERETIEEEKAQVDRYKQLLLKQRDIMIALTQRLVERDEQIMALQEELDAYDWRHKELEEKLDEKTALLIKFQRISMEVSASSPNKNEELTLALKTWSKLEEETTGRPKLREGMRAGAGPGGAGTGIGGGGREIGEGVGIAERDRVREGSAGGVRRIVGSTAVEVESDSDYNDDLGNSTQSSVVMTRSTPLPVPGHPPYPPSDSSPVRSSTDVMSAVVGEVEAALRKLESERRTETADSTPALRATREAVTDIMRGVLARVSQFSNTSTTEDVQGNSHRSAIGNNKNDSYNINNNSNIGNHSITGNGNSAFNSIRSNQDNLVIQLQREKSILENRVRLLEDERNTESGSKIPPISPIQSNGENEQNLKVRCDVLTREREAVQTIMEQKIKVLVQSVANALQAVLLEAPSAGGQAGDALAKDVAALQRLVNASIAALKNASSASAPPSPAPSVPSQSPSSSSFSSFSSSALKSDPPNIGISGSSSGINGSRGQYPPTLVRPTLTPPQQFQQMQQQQQQQQQQHRYSY